MAIAIALLKRWEDVTDDLAKAFINTYFQDYEEIFWVNNEVGGVLCIGDGSYVFTLDLIMDALRYSATREQLLNFIENPPQPKINFKTFVKYYKPTSIS